MLTQTREARAADCSAVQILLSSQAEVDQFQAQHGPCAALTGQLLIYDEFDSAGVDIVNLNGLASLVSVGDLSLLSNPVLTSVAGLSSLRTVTGSLWIQRSRSLASLAGLQSVRTIGHSLLIGENDLITDLDVFSSVETIGEGGLFVYTNPRLANLEGLRSIRSVGGGVGLNGNGALANVNGLRSLRSVGAYLTIGSNDSLQSLAGLASLRSIGEWLRVEGNLGLETLAFGPLDSVGFGIELVFNPELASLAGLQRVTKVSNLSITGNTSLANLDGLASLAEITGNMELEFNSALLDIDGLGSLRKIGGIDIRSNDSLRNLDGFSGLTTIEGDAFIAGQALATIEGLTNLTSIGGWLSLESPLVDDLRPLSSLKSVGNLGIWLPSLTTLDGLQSLETVTYDLVVSGNTKLISLAGLGPIEEVQGLGLEDNDALVDFRGLDHLEHVGSFGVRISGNDSLRSLSGLDSLETITGNLYVGTASTGIYNRALSSLDGLDSFTSVEGSIRIELNPLLADLDGLSRLTNAGSLSVVSNPRLADCSGLVRLLDAVDDPPVGTGNPAYEWPDVGSVELVGNRPGCNSRVEVLAAPPDHPCVRDDHTACLLDDRFRVRADMWDFSIGPFGLGARTPGVVQTYDGVRAETDIAVSFYSFQEGNVELFVKMLDACPVAFHTFWVFAAGATNAEAEVEVLDTWTGERFRVYNRRGGRFATTAATDAFATCEAFAPPG